MKKIFFIATLFLAFAENTLFAQLQILNVELLAEFKNTTTLVFMPATDTTKHQIYRELMEENWKLTPMIFLSYNQYKEYKDKKGYSFLLFGDDHINDGTSISSYVYFELWIWNTTNGDWNSRKKAQLARLELYPDPETTFDPSLIYDYRYNTEGHIFNWSPGMFKNYMQMIEKHLKEGTKRSTTRAGQNLGALEKLKKTTLYIPEYVLEQHSAFQKVLGKISASELMADYPYPYKVVPNAELSKMLMDSKEPIYYLLFVRSNSDKYVAIVEGHEGQFVYNRHTPQSFNVKKGDLRKLAKVITEGK